MLRLFSTIRKTLINEGKTSRYVRYAVGEVLLIMVGILLALQVQTWNVGRTESNLAEDYIARLKEDVEADIDSIKRWVEFGELRMGFTELLINSVNDPEITLNRPVEYLVALRSASSLSTVILQANTFEELKSTGLLRLLGNQNLKKQLFNYYSYDQWVRQYDLQRRAYLEKFDDLTRDVLTPEQKIWFINEVNIASPGKMEAIKQLTIDESWASGAAKRVRDTPAIESYLPELLGFHKIHIVEHEIRQQRAEALLETLKEAQENLKR